MNGDVMAARSNRSEPGELAPFRSLQAPEGCTFLGVILADRQCHFHPSFARESEMGEELELLKSFADVFMVVRMRSYMSRRISWIYEDFRLTGWLVQNRSVVVARITGEPDDEEMLHAFANIEAELIRSGLLVALPAVANSD